MDEITFVREITQLYRQLYNYSLKLTKNHCDAEDLVQDTYIKAIKGRLKYDSNQGTLKSWIMTVLFHCFIDKVRKEGKVGHQVEINDSLDIVTYQRDRLTDKQELNLINQLDNKKHQNIIRDVSQGLTYEELAEKYKTPIGTIKATINRIRKSLVEKRTELHKIKNHPPFER